MKKMILMLMAMVVFGNVLGAWDPIKYTVIEIAFVPPNSNHITSNDGAIFFAINENPTSVNDWVVYHTKIGTDLSSIQKAILAILMNAQSNGKKVLIDQSGHTLTIEGQNYRSFSVLKLVN